MMSRTVSRKSAPFNLLTDLGHQMVHVVPRIDREAFPMVYMTVKAVE